MIRFGLRLARSAARSRGSTGPRPAPSAAAFAVGTLLVTGLFVLGATDSTRPGLTIIWWLSLATVVTVAVIRRAVNKKER